MKAKLPTALALFALSTCLISGVSAQTINWVSTASTVGNGGTKHFQSDGTALPNGFTFQLGYFDAGFNPAEPTTWEPNWHVLGTTPYNGNSTPGPPFIGFNFQASTTVLAANAAFTGKQGYIWGFDNKTDMGTPAGEALIITSGAWTFPAFDNPVADNWSVSNATSVVFGRIDGNVALAPAGTGLIVGDGEFSAAKAVDTFHVQTGTWLAPVPEPGSALLLLGCAGLATLRRRRPLA